MPEPVDIYVKDEPGSPAQPAQEVHAANHVVAEEEMDDDMEPKDIEIEYDDTEEDVLALGGAKPQDRPRAPPPSPLFPLVIRKVNVRLPNFQYFPRHLTPDGSFLVSRLRHSHPAFFKKPPGSKKKKEMLVSAKSTGGGGLLGRPGEAAPKPSKKLLEKEKWVQADVAPEPSEKPILKVKAIEFLLQPPAEEVKESPVVDENPAASSSEDDEESSEWPSQMKVTIRNMNVRVERLHKNIVSFKYKLYKEYVDRQQKKAGAQPQQACDGQSGVEKKKRGRKKKLVENFLLLNNESAKVDAAKGKEANVKRVPSIDGQSLADPVTPSTPAPDLPIIPPAPVLPEASVPTISATVLASDDTPPATLPLGTPSVSKDSPVSSPPRQDPVKSEPADDIEVLSEIVPAKTKESKPVVEVDLSDSDESEKEEEEEGKEKDEVVANPFFTDSDDSDQEEEEEEQAKEKEKLVEMLYSLIKGDDKPSSPEKTETLVPLQSAADDTTNQQPSVEESAAEKGAEAPSLGQESKAGGPVDDVPVALDLFDQIATGMSSKAATGTKNEEKESAERSSEPDSTERVGITYFSNNINYCRGR